MRIKVEESEKELNFKLNRNDESTHCHKAKTRSDLQTETTLSPHEFYGLNGLAGSTAYFKRSKCSACRLLRLVFWFGNPSNNNKADRFLCVECVKTVTGVQKFVDIVSSEHSWSFPLEKEVMASRRNMASKDTRKPESDKLDDPSLVLNGMLELKQIEINYLLTKMVNCLNICKQIIDSESKLLAFRFIHNHLESLMKISHIFRIGAYQKKLECLDSAELAYFSSEIKKQHAISQQYVITNAQPIASRKCSGADLMQLLNTNRSSYPPKKSSFFMDYDDRPFLTKRDGSKIKSIFEDYDDIDNDQPLKSLFEGAHTTQGLHF